MIESAPVIKHYKWPYPLRDIADRMPWLRQVPLDPAKAILATPVTVARGIARFYPELAQCDRLRLLLLGAEEVDAIDGGRWLRLVGPLLGQPRMQVEVTLIGKELRRDDPVRTGAPLDRLDANQPAITLVQQDIASYLAQNGTPFDVAVMLHPGFEAHFHEWFEGDGLKTLARGGVRMFGASYAESEAHFDLYILSRAGFATEEREIEKNPFSVKMGPTDDDTEFGSHLWPLRPGPNIEVGNDEAALADVATYYRNGLLSAGQGWVNQSLGAPLKIAGDDSISLLFERFAYRRATGELFAIEQQDDGSFALVQLDDRLTPSELARLEATATGPFGRVRAAIWHGVMREAHRRALEQYLKEQDDDEETWGSFLDANPDLAAASGIQGPREMTNDEVAYFGPVRADPGLLPGAIERLKRRPAYLTMQDDNGQTILFYAVGANSAELVAAALAAGADPNHRDREGFTPLLEAARIGAAAVVGPLVSGGAIVNDPEASSSPLLVSVMRNHFTTVDALLACGADMKHKLRDGFSVQDVVDSGGRVILESGLKRLADH